ncbi:MAG: trigger factor [Saprospiraceae bacterium]
MPKVNLEEIDKLNAVVDIAVTPEDYEPEMKKELKKLATSQNMKGFRKGKTPISFIKKVYGKGVLGEIVSKMFSEELDKIMRSEDAKYIGSPLLVKGQPQLDFNPDAKETYSLKFELGKAPEFEVKGLDENKEFTLFKLKVDDKRVEEEYQKVLKSWGKDEETDEPVELGFVVNFNAKELDENGAVKEGGVQSSFHLSINDEFMNEEFVKAVSGKKKGDKFQFYFFKAFKNNKPEDIMRSLLKLSDEEIETREVGDNFELEIVEVEKTIPAEANQELFDKVFGEGEVSNDAEAKARIKESLQSRKLLEGNSLLFREMRNYLVDQNRADMPLPEDFLKRYVQEENAREAERILEKFDEFLDDLRWDLIASKLIKQFEVEVSAEDVRNATAAEIRQYMGGYGDQAFLDSMVTRMLQNQDHVRRTYERVMYDKLYGKLKEAFKVVDKEVEEEKLDEMYAEVFKSEEPAVDSEDNNEEPASEESGSEEVTA